MSSTNESPVPKITYVKPDGTEIVVQAQVGQTLMESAVKNGVSGIVAECGGACQCATCHVYVPDPWRERLPAVSAVEEAMLDNTLEERRPNSRLSCQIELRADFDGLVVYLPNRQI